MNMTSQRAKAAIFSKDQFTVLKVPDPWESRPLYGHAQGPTLPEGV
jgi:hypothetical protein